MDGGSNLGGAAGTAGCCCCGGTVDGAPLVVVVVLDNGVGADVPSLGDALRSAPSAGLFTATAGLMGSDTTVGLAALIASPAGLRVAHRCPVPF